MTMDLETFFLNKFKHFKPCEWYLKEKQKNYGLGTFCKRGRCFAFEGNGLFA